MQAMGVAPPSQANAAELALRQVLRKQVEAEQKKTAKPSSYAEFVRSWRKMGKMTRETSESDPSSYWQMEWHRQSVECVYLEHGWPAAQEYHRRVMESWEAGFLDAESHIDTEEFRRGNVRGSLHMVSYFEALSLKGKAGPRQAGAHASAGSPTKQRQDDTWCAEHGCWFPKGDNHSWSWITKVGTCRVAKSKLK